MNSASSGKQTTDFISPLATASMAATLAVVALFGFASAPTTRAEAPESQLKLAGAIPLTTELLDKMEKFLTSVKSDAAAKAELVAALKENKDNPLATGEAWGSLISAKCPKAVEIFQASGLTPDEFGKAGLAIEAIIMGDAMAPPGDKRQYGEVRGQNRRRQRHFCCRQPSPRGSRLRRLRNPRALKETAGSYNVLSLR